MVSGMEQAHLPAKVREVRPSIFRYKYPGIMAQVSKWDCLCLISFQEQMKISFTIVQVSCTLLSLFLLTYPAFLSLEQREDMRRRKAMRRRQSLTKK